MPLTKEEITSGLNRLKVKLIEICKNDGIKYESKKFYELQTAMIAGFIACTDEVPVSLGIAIMTERPIVNEF